MFVFGQRNRFVSAHILVAHPDPNCSKSKMSAFKLLHALVSRVPVVRNPGQIFDRKICTETVSRRAAACAGPAIFSSWIYSYRTMCSWTGGCLCGQCLCAFSIGSVRGRRDRIGRTCAPSRPSAVSYDASVCPGIWMCGRRCSTCTELRPCAHACECSNTMNAGTRRCKPCKSTVSPSFFRCDATACERQCRWIHRRKWNTALSGCHASIPCVSPMISCSCILCYKSCTRANSRVLILVEQSRCRVCFLWLRSHHHHCHLRNHRWCRRHHRQSHRCHHLSIYLRLKSRLFCWTTTIPSLPYERVFSVEQHFVHRRTRFRSW